jgi:hypothetical protein
MDPFLLAMAFVSPQLPGQVAIRVPSQAPTIQAAIARAQDGEVVLVAPGRYLGVIDFLGKSITVRSEAGAASTIIDGNDGSFLPVVSFHHGEGPDSILRGFTVTGGDNRFSDSLGGGISCVHFGQVVQGVATPTIEQCVITSNRTLITPGAGVAGNPILVDCTISDNVPGNAGDGGGVWGAPTMRRCVVERNRGRDGGGLYLAFTGSSALIEDCVITGNIVQEGTRGGGIYTELPSVVVRRCLIARNTSIGFSGMLPVSGAGVFSSPTGQARFEHCTIVANSVLEGSVFGENWGGVFGQATLIDCIVRDNDEVQVDTRSSASFSNVEGGFPGTGNIDLEPLFVDAPNDVFRLRPGSPCIDAGDPAGALDPDFTRADMGAFSFAQANAVLRNGSGVNRVGFTSLTPPVVGGTWNARIDSSGHPGVLVSAIVVVDRPLKLPRLLPAGELLIDPFRPVLARLRTSASGGLDDFAVTIPPLPAWIGFHATAQAYLSGGGTELLNALDLRLGH